jgi:hypothetical protein
MNDIEYKEFKKQFWEWFDDLPSSQRQNFAKFSEDLAETHFFFKVYQKKLENLNKTY